MVDAADPELNWRKFIFPAVFALAGSLILAFVFMPFFAPDTDPVWAFFGSLAFMAITIAAMQTVNRS